MKKFRRGIFEEVGFEMTDMMGKLKDGTPWKLSPWNGDFLVHDDEYGWVEPGGSFANRHNDEFFDMCMGSICEKIEAAAKAWGKEYGQNWAGPEFWDEETFILNIRHAAEFVNGGLNWPNFQQFLANACFYGGDDQKEVLTQFFVPYEGDNEEEKEEWEWWTSVALQPDGWLGQIILDAAQDAAYEETIRREAELEDENEDEDENA